MAFDFQRTRPLLHSGDLPKLFVEELGWEPCRQNLTLRAGETDYAFTAIAEKRGFTAWLCACTTGCLPDHNTRLKLDRALTQTSFEHLIVFAAPDLGQQSWVWVRREPGRPLSAKTHEFNRGQPGDSLLAKLQILYVSLEEEEAGLSITQMAGRARAAFDLDRITKAFYREFDTHRKAFLKFIDGIGEVADREWYASVMLNRLMFVYFIQRKGFLDADPHYLRNRLKRCQQEQGKDKFYTFYRYFLLRLFHEGFGKRRKDRAPDLEKLLGSIPYLNGGLFDVHELERPDRYGKEIQIPDKAFERVFNYFDQYQWYLDERPLRADNEINPDVLGYIFEKYINQKQMGAYYTKEDITEYISKSTVIPFLFDAARSKCKIAFDAGDDSLSPSDGERERARVRGSGSPPIHQSINPSTHSPTVWDLLRENPDRYIYPAVRHGADKNLPPEIAAGLDTTKPNLVERRKAWNKPAPSEYALPTEIWREVVARRQRYWEVWSRLSGRQANPDWVANPPTAAEALTSAFSLQPLAFSVNDFVTLNLDLRQFAQDVIQNCEGPDLLMAFWQAIITITILDPTGGSGAFIFAALNILEPLYEACLDRMEAFLAEWGVTGSPLPSDARGVRGEGKPLHPNYTKKFTEVLARMDAHPNRRYFVLKSIILNNLYAVDIMEEAVEICKLRLFLKLAAQVEPDTGRDNLGIEPLPDIDFNIRAGNTLVGYATKEEVRRCMKELGGGQMKLMGEEELGSFSSFNTRCADVEQAFAKFRQLQTEGDGSVPYADKLELQKRLKTLEGELNRHLAGEYGVKVSDKCAYAKWVKSHQPFHWFIQFYGILNGGGFDVIIGNPPYVELKELTGYRIRGYKCEEAGNLYALVIERCNSLGRGSGHQGFIVPVSSVSTDRYASLQRLLLARENHFSSYDDRPSRLFDGLEHIRLTIHIIGRETSSPHHFSTRYNKWNADERPALFGKLLFSPTQPVIVDAAIPKLSSQLEQSIVQKLTSQQRRLSSFYSRTTRHQVFYSRKVGYFLQVLDFEPCVLDGKGCRRPPSEFKELTFASQVEAQLALCCLNSSLFYWFITVFSDCRHVNKREVDHFPIDLEELAKSGRRKGLQDLAAALMQDLKQNSVNRKMTFQHDTLTVQCIYPKTSKPIADQIDIVLAKHYRFTDEELDFILNYDIKYRLGRDTEAEAD